MLGDERPETVSGNGEGLPDGTVKAKGKPGRKPGKLKAEVPATDMAAVVAELSKLVIAQTEQGQKNTLEAIKELKKPSLKEIREEEEAQKKEIRIKENRLRQIADTQTRETFRAQQIESCSHSTYNQATKVSSHAWRGQVHAPAGVEPYFIPTCLINQCQLKLENGELLKIPATMEMITNGVNLDQYPNLTVETIRAWHKQVMEQKAREAKQKQVQVA